jgi:hypothetical protein
VSYFTDVAAIRAWKQDAQHLVVQRYSHYRLRIAKVERDDAGMAGR